MAHTAAPKSGQSTIPMLAPTNPNAAPNRSPGGVVSPTRLPVCASHAVNAPTKPVAAPMAAGSPPGVLAGLSMLRERPTEERVRRLWIADEVVLDTCILQRAVERIDVVRRYARVGTTEETEDRRAHPWRSVAGRRPLLALAGRETAIETNDARELGVLRRGEERLPATHAEAENVDASRVRRAAKVSDRARSEEHTSEL